MCGPAALLVASAAVSVVGSLSGARAARKANEASAEQEALYAAEVRDEAIVEARNTRRAGERTRGAARAAFAGSGVRVDDMGTVDTVDAQITRDYEQDAHMAILMGERKARAGLARAEQYRQAGRNATRAGWFDATSTALSAAGRMGFGGGK